MLEYHVDVNLYQFIHSLDMKVSCPWGITVEILEYISTLCFCVGMWGVIENMINLFNKWPDFSLIQILRALPHLFLDWYESTHTLTLSILKWHELYQDIFGPSTMHAQNSNYLFSYNYREMCKQWNLARFCPQADLYYWKCSDNNHFS